MSSASPSVLVLMGGPDAERPVSLSSGEQVVAALSASGRFEVLPAVIDRPGVEELESLGGDVVFPVLHGRWGEGGPLQSLLEQVGLPYVGSGPRASALAMDKLATKTMVASQHVPTPPCRQLGPDDDCDLDPPLVLKPVDEGSSVDLVVCHARDELDAARERLHRRHERLMAERYVRGRELTVGIAIDQALPIVEIVPAEGLYDYAAKYEREDTRYHVEPVLPEDVAATCRRVAVLVHRLLGCRDVSRVDFILEGSTPWLLEINTMPGFTTHSLVPMAAAHAGCPLPELCARLVDSAMSRGRPAFDRPLSTTRF